MKHQLTALAILSTAIINTASGMENDSPWPRKNPSARRSSSPQRSLQHQKASSLPTHHAYSQPEEPSPQYIPVVMPTHKQEKLNLQKAQFCAELLRTHNNGHETVPMIDATEATRDHSRIFLEMYTGKLSADGYNTAEQIRSYSQTDSQ